MNDPVMTLRIQAEVTEIVPGGFAKLVMQDVREERLPFVAIARDCPEGLSVGQTALFSGEMEIRQERQGQQIMSVPVLTVRSVEPATALSPWAHLDCVGRVVSEACTLYGPTLDADGMVLLKSYTAIALALPTREGRSVPLQVIHSGEPDLLGHIAHDATSDLPFVAGEQPPPEQPDELSALKWAMFGLHKGDRVHASGDLCLMARMPDDEPGADLQIIVETLERV